MGLFAAGFNRKVAARVADLRKEVEAASKVPAATKPQALADVPTCVRRYLEYAAVGSPELELVTSRQVVELRFEADGPWRPMDAQQVISPLVPALVWSVKSSVKRCMGMRGCDWRAGGRGAQDWRLWGWLPAVRSSGPTLDATTLVRWLADRCRQGRGRETPGIPRAMLPSPFLRWEAVEGANSEARAVLTHGGASVSGVFAFNEGGLVVSFRSTDYVLPADKTSAPGAAWVVRYSKHAFTEVAGSQPAATVFVPTEAEVVWEWPSGREVPVTRFRLERQAAA